MALRSVVARALDKKTTRRPRQKPQRARRSNRLSSSQSTEQSVESTEEDNETGTDENNDGDGGGSEDDEGGEESDDTGQMGNASVALQQLQTLMKRTGKKEDFEGGFKKRIREEEQRLLRLLDEEKKRRRAEAEKFQSRFASILAMALSPPGTPRRAPTHSGEIQADISPGSHPLHARSEAIIKSSENVTNEYKRLVEYASNVEDPPALSSTWEKDYNEIKRLADLGYEASETEIKSLLTYKGEEESRRAKWRRKTQREKLKDDAHLQEMLEMGRETLGERERSREVRGWQVVAHKAQTGLEAMVKALPDEDETLCSVDESQ